MLRLTVLAAAALLATPDRIDDIAANLTELNAKIDFVPVGAIQKGALAEGASTQLTLDLKGGKTYLIEAVCDDDCTVLGLSAVGPDGIRLDNDDETEDLPSVTVDASGRYTVTLTMKQCASTCAFGLIAYRK